MSCGDSASPNQLLLREFKTNACCSSHDEVEVCRTSMPMHQCEASVEVEVLALDTDPVPPAVALHLVLELMLWTLLLSLVYPRFIEKY